jgi:hypothetical protein
MHGLPRNAEATDAELPRLIVEACCIIYPISVACVTSTLINISLQL